MTATHSATHSATSTATREDTREQLLNAILNHVPFDGWTETSFRAAIAECGSNAGLARALCPRGAVDLALAFHARGDRAMLDRIRAGDPGGPRFRDRITAAVRHRLQAVENKEAVRRGVTLFALPNHAADGARAIWGTCDLIWAALGDTSEDVNWYTKRAILSGVYSATLLFWLGDDSPDHQATWDFLDRRIEGVMQFEKLKARVKDNPLLKPFLAVPNWLVGHVKAPAQMPDNLPGTVSSGKVSSDKVSSDKVSSDKASSGKQARRVRAVARQAEDKGELPMARIEENCP